MSRVLQAFPAYFQRFPIVRGDSMRHSRNMPIGSKKVLRSLKFDVPSAAELALARDQIMKRIELPTNGLQNRCSTAELTRLIQGRRATIE